MAVCCTFGTKELYIISQKVKYFFTKNNQKIHKTSHQSLNTRCILQKSLCITNMTLNFLVRRAFKTLPEHLDLFLFSFSILSLLSILLHHFHKFTHGLNHCPAGCIFARSSRNIQMYPLHTITYKTL